MKKLAFWLAFISLFFAFKTSAYAAIDQINSFKSEITINQDTSVSIKENLEYQTDLQKHGIYRYVPVIYHQDGQKIKLDITHVKVTDPTGKAIPYTKSYDSGFLNLKIGDPDHTFTGYQNYVIEYQVARAVTEQENYDQLYWDITGDGWQIPVLSSQAVIKSEFAPIDQVECFSGDFGSDDGQCQSSTEANEIVFTYERPINYGQNLTVKLQLNPDNQLHFPTPLQKAINWLQLNWVMFLLPVPLLVMFGWWWQHGRDFEFLSPNVFNLDPDQPTRLKPFSLTQRKPMVYEPLKDLTPGEAGALMDEKVDTQDIVAEILELARKKFLKIELIEKKKLLGKSRDYQLTKLKEATSSLSVVQKYLHQQLFKGRDQVKISTLKGTFYTTMAEAGKKLNQSLVSKKLYTQSPTLARGKAMTVAILMIVGLVGLIIWQLVRFQIFWPLLVVMGELPLCLIFAYQMPQKTAVGNALALQALGLQNSIRYGKWREEIKEKNLFIEEVLPFAVSLGVVTQLANQMKDLNLQPPEYLHTTALTTWSTTQFVSDFSQEVGSTLSYNPSSSSSSSGGGFSGGGGGGGGGGSW